jgi:hypothetical protein
LLGLVRRAIEPVLQLLGEGDRLEIAFGNQTCKVALTELALADGPRSAIYG